MNDALKKHLESIKAQEAARMASSLDTAPTPEDALAGLQAERGLGIPAAMGAAQPQSVLSQMRFKTDTAALSSAPGMAAWLGDPVNGGLAKDDLGNLTWFERNLGAAGRAAGRGVRRVVSGAKTTGAFVDASSAIDVGKSLQEIIEEEVSKVGGSAAPQNLRGAALQAAQMRFEAVQGLGEDDKAGLLRSGAENFARARALMDSADALPMSDAAESFKGGALTSAGNSVLETLGAFAQDPVGGAAFLAETAAEFLPVLAAATVATVATKTPGVGVAAMSAGSFMQEQGTTALSFLDEKKIDLSTPEAALELFSQPDLWKEARDRGVTRGLVVAAFDAMSGGIAGKQLMNTVGGDLVAQGIAQAVLGAAGEGFGQASIGDDLDWQEITIEALAELATAPVEVVGVGGRGIVRAYGDYARSAKTTEALDRLDEMAAASKVRERDSAKFKESLETGPHAQDAFYIEASKVREFFQAKDVSIDDDTLAGWGIDVAGLEELEAIGGDLTVGMPDYAATLSGTDAGAWLRENGRLSPDALSEAEAAEFNIRAQEIMQEAYQEQVDMGIEADQMRAADVQVEDAMFSQLRAAGRSPDVAKMESALWTAFFRTQASRLGGEDALTLAERFGVEVRGPDSADGGRRRGNLDIMLNAIRSGKQPKPGMSLMEYVIADGGVIDAGGDLESMDAPRGLISETAAQVRERRNQPSLSGVPSAASEGRSLEDVATKLIEAGYFPEYGGDATGGDGNLAPELERLVLDALAAELQGEKSYIPGDGPDQDFAALEADLNTRGIDIDLSNDEIADLLKSDGDGAEYSQESRGSILFPENGPDGGNTVINLFAGADLSTFIHESGHFFLEASSALASDQRASDQMREDMAAVREWLGNDGGAFTTEQHEQWARGIEAYTLEGKAPSLALADAFGRFKAWLTRIYKTARNLDVKISPEVRDVMDRMLATDAEIAEAQREMSADPLFSDGIPPGMSKQDFAAYQRIAKRSTETAERKLLEKTMAKVRREREAWYKEERKAVRKEVEGDVARRREFRLTEWLANQRYWGSDKEVSDMRIDRGKLAADFSGSVFSELSRAKLGGKRAIYAKDGESPASVADFFGFSTVTEMVETLQNTGKMKDTIEAETDAVMNRRHGDPLNDGSIEEEALAAIHNEDTQKVRVTEARHLATQLGRKPTRAQVYRQRARMVIAQMPVQFASKPAQFRTAERRAARKSQDAFARVARGGGREALATAYQAKEQQILNGYLYDESRKVEAEVSKGRERMRKYEKKSVREKIGGDYMAQIDSILADYNFRVMSQKDIQRNESLKDFVARMVEDGRANEVNIDDATLNRAKAMHYTKLSVSDLRGLFDTIANIDHLGRYKQTLIDRNKKRQLDAVVSEIEAALAAGNGTPPNRVATSSETRKRIGRDYMNLVLNADTLLREIDGWSDLGSAWMNLKGDIDAGMGRLIERRVKMASSFDAIYDRYSTKEKAAMSKMEPIPELGGQFSKWNLIAIALNTGNQENYARLTNSQTPGGFSPDQVEQALGRLDARDWETVQSIWDYIETFWSEIAEKEKRNTGTVPRKVEAQVMSQSAPDNLRGGYYPIKYDARLSSRITEFESKDLTDRMRAGSFGKAQTKNGHTKERKDNVKLPLTLDLSVVHSHVSQVLYDLEIGEAVNNSYKILTDPRVSSAFREKGKAADHEALEIWLQDVAAGEQVSARGMERVQRRFRSGFVVSRLAMNISTALIQPSGLSQSAVMIGKKEVAKASVRYFSNPKRSSEDVLAVSPFMRERQKTFERDIFNVVGDLESGPAGRWEKFHRDFILPSSFYMMQKVQFYGVDMPTWMAAHDKEMARSGNEDRAQTYADSMVRRAQGSGLMSDRGMLERGTISRDSRQREFPRLLTALGSYMFAKGNVAYEKTMATNFKSPVEALSWAMDMALLFTFEALLYSAVKGFLPELDGEDDAQDVAKWLVQETGLSMMSTMPGLREVAGGIGGFGGGGIMGAIVEGAFVRPINESAQGDFDRSFVKSMVGGAGIWFQLPSSQTNAIINGFFDQDMSRKSDPDFAAMFGVGGEGRVSLADWVMRDE